MTEETCLRHHLTYPDWSECPKCQDEDDMANQIWFRPYKQSSAPEEERGA